MQVIYFEKTEIKTSMQFKISIIWNITPYTPAKTDRRFGGTYRTYECGKQGIT